MGDAMPAAEDWSWAFDREADADIEAHFPWGEMTPEEYAARHAHQIGCYSLDRMRYRDPAIGCWAVRLGEVLARPAELERARREWLTPAEYAEVQRQIADIAEHGL
jgi:hypothetical protein